MPGVKLFDPFRRKEGTSVADFSHHWITHHAEIVKPIRRITRYVQSLRIPVRAPVLEALFPPVRWDGCAETWHADPSSVAALVDEPRFAELMADERSFLDLSAARHLTITEEHLLDEHGFDPRERGVKLSLFVRRAPRVSGAEFGDLWSGAPADAVHLGRRLGVVRHVVCTRVGSVRRDAEDDSTAMSGSRGDGFDGVREMWWPSRAALESGLAAHPEFARMLLTAGAVDSRRSSALIGQERIIVP